jgi:hypothetical protein
MNRATYNLTLLYYYGLNPECSLHHFISAGRAYSLWFRVGGKEAGVVRAVWLDEVNEI